MHSAAIQGWKKLSKMQLYHVGRGLSVEDLQPYSADMAVRLIECKPLSDYYTSAHWNCRFSDVQFSSDAADIRCPMCESA